MKQICKKKFYSEHLFKYNVFYVAVKVTIKNYRSQQKCIFVQYHEMTLKQIVCQVLELQLPLQRWYNP